MPADLFGGIAILHHVFQILQVILKDSRFHAVVVTQRAVAQIRSDLQSAGPVFADGNPVQRVLRLTAESGAKGLRLGQVEFFARLLRSGVIGKAADETRGEDSKKSGQREPRIR